MENKLPLELHCMWILEEIFVVLKVIFLDSYFTIEIDFVSNNPSTQYQVTWEKHSTRKKMKPQENKSDHRRVGR